jgi:hypothetical protein
MEAIARKPSQYVLHVWHLMRLFSQLLDLGIRNRNLSLNLLSKTLSLNPYIAK